MPVLVSTGKITLSVPVAFSVRPKVRGMEGPVISASKMAVRRPALLAAMAIRDVTMDLPTPPLPDTTPMTFFTELSGFK